MPLFYKYRSIPVCGSSDSKHFIEIFENNQLYAAFYSQLNDPLEGHYDVNKENIPQSVIDKIRYGKHKTRVCSLSSESNNYLMWAHYADGGRGVAIGVNVTDDKQPQRVIYSKQLPAFKPEMKAEDILMYKHDLWTYECEHRVLTDGQYVKVEVKEVVLGSKMVERDKIWVKNLIKKVSSEVNVVESPPPSRSIFAM